MNLKELWQTQGAKFGLKVRFRDWDHRTKYFVIEEFDEQMQVFSGKLSTGEKINYDASSYPWKMYYEGDLQAARAV